MRAAASRRQLRLLLQQEAFQAGRADPPAEDVLGAHHLREEAHAAKRRRFSQGRRLRPQSVLLPRRRGHRRLWRADRRYLLRQRGEVEPLPPARVDTPAGVAEEPHRLLRLQQARALADRGG